MPVLLEFRKAHGQMLSESDVASIMMSAAFGICSDVKPYCNKPKFKPFLRTKSDQRQLLPMEHTGGGGWERQLRRTGRRLLLSRGAGMSQGTHTGHRAGTQPRGSSRCHWLHSRSSQWHSTRLRSSPQTSHSTRHYSTLLSHHKPAGKAGWWARDWELGIERVTGRGRGPGSPRKAVTLQLIPHGCTGHTCRCCC